jgi:hypothetical protein
MVLDKAQERLNLPDLVLEAATDTVEVEEAFRKNKFDHVFMGTGTELDERLAVVRRLRSQRYDDDSP